MRDGTPLPGRNPDQLLSQLAHRVLGPLRPHRIRAVVDYHGVGKAPASGQARIAARYGVTTRSLTNWVTAVGAAGARIPLRPEMTEAITRRSRPGEDHLGRTRVARTFGLPPPQPALPQPQVASGRILPGHRAAAAVAIRVLATVGPLPVSSLQAAIQRARRFRQRQQLTEDQVAAALLSAGATVADGLWQAPAGVMPPERYLAIATVLAGRELTRSQLIEALIGVGYAPSSADGRINQTHPLIRRCGPDRYQLIDAALPIPAAPTMTSDR